MKPTLIYQVSVGPKSKLYDFCTASVKEYAARIGADYYIQTSPILSIRPDPFTTNRSKESYEKYGGYLPIYEKENAFEFLSSYEKVAVIDADVYVRPNAPNIFDELDDNFDFAAVAEREMPLTSPYLEKIINYSRMQYDPLRDVNWKWSSRGAEFFNMGVMVLNQRFRAYLRNQSPKEFLYRFEFKRFIDGMGAWKWSTDQTLLNWWVKKENMSVKHLDWKFNGLFNALEDGKNAEAHFVHFFLKDKLKDKGEDVEDLIRQIS